MKLTVLGCSPAWPNPGGTQSGYLVEGPGRLLLDCGPGVLARPLARDADLFLCEATLEHGGHDGNPRGHLSAEEAIEAFTASGARRLLITHRPVELPLDDGLEQAHDGLELDV